MKRRVAALFIVLFALAGTSSAGFGRVSADAPAFTDPAFQQLWQRTDSLIAQGVVKRSYYWGPQPNSGPIYEDYSEGLGGKHLVQYFDKSRMEINNPTGNKSSKFYVTNGLLTEELITGKMQVGDNSFVSRYPAQIDIASDTDDTSPTAPTYASFQIAISSNAEVDDWTGTNVSAFINRNGYVGYANRFANYNVNNAYYETATRHNIPLIFWQFLNQSGPVLENGMQRNALLNDPWFYATGYPISEAYWATAKIAGQANTDVLIQAYERRVLTYVPSAPDGFKVQMGNIGQHYYDWRYNNAGSPPTTPTAIPSPPQPTPTNGPLSCYKLPKRGFGELWASNTTVQQELGCPYADDGPINVAQQSFEHGQMIDRINKEGDKTYKTVFVLYDDTTAQGFTDDYDGSSPLPVPTPPPGYYAPEGGFAKVWLEQTAARVREKLGWATSRVVLDVSDDKGAEGGIYQQFNRGAMIYSGPTLKKIYVLYNTDPNRYGNYDPYKIDHWAVYDDTYPEPLTLKSRAGKGGIV